MQDARYFRDQAALTLDIARQMSDPHAAEKLRSDAAQYFARALELERDAEAVAQPRPVADGKSTLTDQT